MKQRSLFPDGFEVQEQAFAALRELDVESALVLVRRARRIDPRLVDLDGFEEALVWLQAQLVGDVTGSVLAGVLLAAARDGLAGRLGLVAANFVDPTIARFLMSQLRPGQFFLDDDNRVPVALVDLILGNASAARTSLIEAVGAGHGDRGDLWGYLGDACYSDQRPDEANACYVRSLLLDPFAFDAWRLRNQRVGECLRELEKCHEVGARNLLLTEGWITGVFEIPAANSWLTPRQVERLLAETTTSLRAAEAGAGFRRFNLLLYLDRSAAKGQIDMARREEMAELSPDVFVRFMAACRDREARGAGGKAAPR